MANNLLRWAGLAFALLALGVLTAPKGGQVSLPDRAQTWVLSEAAVSGTPDAEDRDWVLIWTGQSTVEADPEPVVDLEAEAEARRELIQIVSIVIRPNDRYLLVRDLRNSDIVGSATLRRFRVGDAIPPSDWALSELEARQVSFERDGETRAFSPFGAERLVLDRFLSEALSGASEVTSSE